MGPVEIADELSPGPCVEDFRTEAAGSYAGHKKRQKTISGNNI